MLAMSVSLRKASRWTVLAVLAASLVVIVPQEARAATLLVPQDFAKIQDAVDAANPGDVIRIKPRKRSYHETVEVITEKLTITKQNRPGRPVVDGFEPAMDEEVFDIDADGVTIKNLIARHGEANGISCTGNRCRFNNIRVDGDTRPDCLVIDGPNSRVLNSVFFGCVGSDGIDIDNGDGAIVYHNTVRLADADCIAVDGDNMQVTSNKIRNCEDSEGIDVGGDNNLIRGNSVRNTDANAIEIDGENNRVIGNLARNIEDDGFDVDGLMPRVRRNVAVGADGGFEISGENPVVKGNLAFDIIDDDGFDIDCNDRSGAVTPLDACDRGLVQNNRGSDNNNDDEGFDIDVEMGTGAGFRILNNVAVDNNSDGFEINVNDGIIAENRAVTNGAEDEPGFDIFGNDNVIQDNVARRNGGEGFEIDGDDNLIRRNLAWANNIDGLNVGGDANRVRKNRAVDNLADGIENDGTNTLFKENVSRFNRHGFDCVNDNTLGPVSGNMCRRGGEFTGPSSGIDG